MPKASIVSLPPGEGPESLERRRSPRAELMVRVDYQSIDEIFSDFARDINEGGMFVETDRPCPVGSEITLHFRIPGSDQPLVSSGRVVRVSPGGDQGAAGMGIEFEGLDQRSRGLINDLIRGLRSRRA